MLQTEDVILTGPPEDGSLKIALKRYSFEERSVSDRPTERLSLIITHAVSSHKESWIPTIEHLAHLQQTAPNSAFCIVEVWLMDYLNHGQAAVLNESAFMSRPDGLSAYEMGRAVQTLLKSGQIRGTSVVGIGHSAGACVMILATMGYDVNQLPFSSMILVDPPMMTPEFLANAMKVPNTPLLAAIDLAKSRVDVWPSRDAARKWLSKRLPYKLWDSRVLQLYVDYALRDLPTAAYPDRNEGVTLSYTRLQEATGYVYFQDGFDGLERLKDLCPAIPVHCIFGDRCDMVAAETQRAITDAAQGRRMASITRVAGAGHLVVQENPKNLALALWGTLHQGRSPKTVTSKL